MQMVREVSSVTTRPLTTAYLELCQTSEMKRFAKKIKNPLTIFEKTLHLKCLTGF